MRIFVAVTLAASIHAQTIDWPASTVCVSNYLSDPLDWVMQSSVNYAAITPVVTIEAGQTTCEDVSTFIKGGAMQDQDYPNSMAINGNLDVPADVWSPFPYTRYDSNAGTMTFVCGLLETGDVGQLCCCSLTNYWLCIWEAGVTYTQCVLPPTATVAPQI